MVYGETKLKIIKRNDSYWCYLEQVLQAICMDENRLYSEKLKITENFQQYIGMYITDEKLKGLQEELKKEIKKELMEENYLISKKIFKDLFECFEKNIKENDIKNINNKEYISKKEGVYFYRNGDVWKIGKSKNDLKDIKNVKGISYIYYLLCKPGVFVPCIQLYNSINMVADSIASNKEIKEYDNQSNNKSLSNKIDVSREKYKKDLAGLKKDLENAKKNNSPEMEMLESEFNDALKHFKRNYFFNSYDRNPEDEKARKSISKCISTAKRKIIKIVPFMQDHLRHIQTGSNIIYLPQTEKPINIIGKDG